MNGQQHLPHQSQPQPQPQQQQQQYQLQQQGQHEQAQVLAQSQQQLGQMPQQQPQYNMPVSLGISSAIQSAHPFPHAPASVSMSNTSNAALAYANAQLAHFAATGGVLPSHMDPNALSVDAGISTPASGASSPGGPYRGLPRTGYSTPGAGLPSLERPIHTNGRVAASTITGKRLNWSDMICQTIAESEHGRLVIQDLFEQMCAKFPEIREWAYGKDWEARVKNRIKSTLSIKGNLFIKVPRPSSAAGKGSWWTLSPEAQESWKAGRVASVVKNQGHVNHGRSASGASSHAAATGGTSKEHTGSMSAGHSHAHSAGGHSVGSQSAGPSSHTGSPVMGRRSINGLSGQSLSMTNLRNAIYSSGMGQPPQALGFSPIQPGMSAFGINPMTAANLHADGFSSPFAATGSMTPTAGYLLESLSMSGLGAPPQMSVEPIDLKLEPLDLKLGAGAANNEDAAQRMRMMENSVNNAFDGVSSAAPASSSTAAVDQVENADGTASWLRGLPAASESNDAAPSSLSPEDATTSSDSDLSNPLDNTTAALLNSLGMEGATNNNFYENQDLAFPAGYQPFSSGDGGFTDMNGGYSFASPDSGPYSAFTPGLSLPEGVDGGASMGGDGGHMGPTAALSPASANGSGGGVGGPNKSLSGAPMPSYMNSLQQPSRQQQQQQQQQQSLHQQQSTQLQGTDSGGGG